MADTELALKIAALRENIRSAGRLLADPTPEKVTECDSLLRSTSSMLEGFQIVVSELSEGDREKLREPAAGLRREVVRLRALLDGVVRFFSGWSAVSSEIAKSYDENGRPVAYVDDAQKISIKA